MDVTLPLWLLLALVAAVAVMGLLIWSSRRTLVGNVTAVALDGIEELLPNLAALTGEPVLGGNRVEVLQNGPAFFDAILADIAAARSSVHYETYVWWRGETCWKLARALAEKARQGVEVRLLLDAHGSVLMEGEVLELLEEAGCQVARFHPFRLRDLGKVNSRNHRKIAVV
ncbi:MAG TPA: phospholipase D-like domain-containing protein, partial [Thermoanaerobaculia bacterium]|nr:phospholipase D-like domain-containing protein [Thermoanaerobaculia bacterium]